MLRKRVKKNAKWRPSGSMVKVELVGFGRGPHNYWEAKKKAEAECIGVSDNSRCWRKKQKDLSTTTSHSTTATVLLHTMSRVFSTINYDTGLKRRQLLCS